MSRLDPETSLELMVVFSGYNHTTITLLDNRSPARTERLVF